MAPTKVLVSDDLYREANVQSIPCCKSEFQDRFRETLMVLLLHLVVRFMFKM